MNLVISGLICFAAAAAEGLLAGGDVRRALRQIRQPAWALSLPGWMVIGLLHYVACFYVLQRLMNMDFGQAAVITAFAVLIVIMAANASFNWLFFRKREFGASFWYYFPYAALVACLIAILSRIDPPSMILFVAYAAYLPYALAWSFCVWRLNPKKARAPNGR